ncbi:regulatory protein RecX [Arthrobacter sp. Leaf234]|uniref:regulatory protein RecX n=1 Tax=Arthrobacter sp. Leaf234 TaxID=1736303 RepID=UPI000ABB916A|nr:regulatory protein RecX [Arthrobacter sp. Leaf234]
MNGDDGAGPVEWGTSFGRFGGDSSQEPAERSDGDGEIPRRQGMRKGLTRFGSSSFGRSGVSRSASGRTEAGTPKRSRRQPGARATSGRGGRSFVDPFGPVVGSSADADADASADVTVGLSDSGESPRARPQGRRRRQGARVETGTGADAALDGPAGPPRHPDGDEMPADAARTDEEWTSLGRSVLLRQLALGARSRHQLDRKLAEREVPPSVASALLDRFVEVQLIDDAEFARMWVRTRIAAKSLSRSSLRRELAEKGIAVELVEDALEQVSDEDEIEQARDVVRRKLRVSADLADRTVREKEMRRLVGVLARKGYNPGSAYSIVKEVIAGAAADAAEGAEPEG